MRSDDIYIAGYGSSLPPAMTAADAAEAGLCDPLYAVGRYQDALARIYFITRNAAEPTVVQCLCTGLQNVVIPAGTGAMANAGPHGFSEALYAYTSATGNNGSAFAGLSANVPFWNSTLGLAMFIGRFLVIIPMLAIAGSLAKKKIVPASLGTFPTHSPLFVGLVVGVIVITGGLIFFPAVSLGPVVEHLAMHAGSLFDTGS